MSDSKQVTDVDDKNGGVNMLARMGITTAQAKQASLGECDGNVDRATDLLFLGSAVVEDSEAKKPAAKKKRVLMKPATKKKSAAKKTPARCPSKGLDALSTMGFDVHKPRKAFNATEGKMNCADGYLLSGGERGADEMKKMSKLPISDTHHALSCHLYHSFLIHLWTLFS